MSVYEYVDPTVQQMDSLFWSLLPVVAEQAGITPDDALYHMRRAWGDRLKAYKSHLAVDFRDDGRAAAWRVRMMIWKTDELDQPGERVADSDPAAAFNEQHIAPGSTIIMGLPAVADWARDLALSCHAARDPGATIDGLEPAELTRKLKSLRVALSNSGGRSAWRLRYAVTTPRLERPEQATPSLQYLSGARPSLQHFCAYVYVQREEAARRNRVST